MRAPSRHRRLALAFGFGLSLAGTGASLAQAPDTAERPAPRPDAAPDAAERPAARPDAAPDVAERPEPRAAAAPDAADRPEARPANEAASAGRPTEVPGVTEAGFADWVVDFRARAAAAGISAATLDAGLADIAYLPRIVELDRSQGEFSRTIWDYLDLAISEARVEQGQARLAEHAGLLSRIGARYGVDRHVVVAIWGLESSYGAVRGDIPVLSALATLAHDGRRGAFFEGELMAALRILDAGEASIAAMRGSWAGAMGHTQFMPSSYERLAVDFTGDGLRDIWREDPTDALASTAAYLADAGWAADLPWGVEVGIPEGFDYTLADRRDTRMPSDWAAIGILDVTGAAVPDHGPASVLLPAGAEGAAFLIFDNFAAIERYNTADAYVIAVGHLADRLRGGPPIAGDWPRGDRGLTLPEREELQRLLTATGFPTHGVDGKIGPLTIDAIRSYQLDAGLTPDGYASVRLLERLR